MSEIRLSEVKLLHTVNYENKSAALKFADGALYLASAALGYEDLTLKKDSVQDKNGPVLEAVQKVNNCAVRFFFALAAIVTFPIALIGLAIKACFMGKQTKEIQTIANGTLASTSTLSLTHSASNTQTLPAETQDEKTRKENDRAALELLKEISTTKDESSVAHRDKFLQRLTEMSKKEFGNAKIKESISQALAKLNKDAEEEIAVQKTINEFYKKAYEIWSKTPEGGHYAQLGRQEFDAVINNVGVDKKMYSDWSNHLGKTGFYLLTPGQFMQTLNLFPAHSGYILYLLSSDLQKTYEQRIAGIAKTKDFNDPKDDAAVRSFFEWMDHFVFNNPSIVTQSKEDILKRFDELVAKKDASRLIVAQWRFVHPADLLTDKDILTEMRKKIDSKIFGEFVQKRKQISCGSVCKV